MHRYFDYFIDLVIVANSARITWETATVSAEEALQKKYHRIAWVGIFFVCIYWAEVLLKLAAYGPRKYWQHGWNRFGNFFAGTRTNMVLNDKYLSPPP